MAMAIQKSFSCLNECCTSNDYKCTKQSIYKMILALAACAVVQTINK